MITKLNKKINPKKIKKNPFTKGGLFINYLINNYSGAMIAKSNKKINPKKSENLLEGYYFYKGMESKFIDLVHLIGGALIYNHFPKELTEHRVKRLYKHSNGRKYLPISLPKIVEITGISLGGLQRIFNHMEKLKLIERIYAKETHDSKECKLLGLTDEGIEYVKGLINEYDSRFKPEKISTQKVYNNKPNINHKMGLVFKKHDDKLTAELLRNAHRYGFKEQITASKARYVHAGYNYIKQSLKDNGHEATEKSVRAHFCAFLEHQRHYLRHYNLYNAFTFKAIKAFITNLMKKGLKCLMGRAKEILLDFLGNHKPMSKTEVEKGKEELRRPKRTLPPELEEPKAEKKQLPPQNQWKTAGFFSTGDVLDVIFNKIKKGKINEIHTPQQRNQNVCADKNGETTQHESYFRKLSKES